MNKPDSRVLRVRDNDELLRAMRPEERRSLRRQIRRLDELTEHWEWIDQLEADLELALAAASEGVFNWPPRLPRSLEYSLAADLSTLRRTALDAARSEHLYIVTLADLEAAQTRLMLELADYYDTHDSITGRPITKETRA